MISIRHLLTQTDNCSFIRSACFKDLITIYYMEKDLVPVLKDGYLLTLKFIFPNSIERQNVKLVLKIIDRTIVAAFETLGPSSPKLINWESTAIFIRILLKFWNIVNVKTLQRALGNDWMMQKLFQVVKMNA